MTESRIPPLTELLRRASAGDRDAANAAYGAVYGDLKRNAARLMRSQPRHHTLDPEGLLHEAYLKVFAAGARTWADRGHFLAVMSKAMRHHLIDRAREKASLRRGGDLRRVPLTGIVLTFEDRAVDLLTLHEAIERLDREHPETARVVELTYFVGLTADDAAEATGTSRRTIARELEFARAWLLRELGT